jgi:hypothetical protein
MTNGVSIRRWLYQHHQLDPVSMMLMSNYLNYMNSQLIPHTPGP